jgi:ferredoxin-nitrate reductase
MLHVIERDGLLDRTFLERHTRGAEDTLTVAADWPPERAAAVCGVPAEDIVAAARRFGQTKRAMALWSMGVNQSTVGTLKNRAILNLCLATGNIGRPGSGPLSLTGQPNAMGGRETGGLAGLLPGYRSVSDPEHRAELRRFWDSPGIAPEPGIAATELVEALEERRVKVVWIVATNPVVSQPDAGRFAAALRRADLVICQDAYFPTETAALAHVMLPAAQWPEKDGTMTNSERRVSLVQRALDPPGEALPDWEIFARVGRALGHREAFAWRTAAQVHDEYVRFTEGRLCDQSGISHARLKKDGPLQWPCPTPEHPGTERLYAARRFGTPDGRARLAPTPHTPPADPVDEDFPLVLTTGRVAQQWHTMTRTGKSSSLLDAEPRPFLELHPSDAERAGVQHDERVQVRSRRGSATLHVRLTETVPEGVAFAPFHWGALHLDAGAGALNQVTARAVDPTSLQPELKACAIRVEPVRVKQRAAGGRRLVVLGAGMAGLATAEAVLAHAEPGAWEITLVGGEREAPYNRVLLSQALAGSVADDRLALKGPEWFAERGVTLRLGAAARRIDLQARELELADGARVGYDELVLAIGSAPWLPPVDGLDRANVHAFRSLADMRAIRAAAKRATTAVVVGGGLLGLEAARGLRELGVDTTVVHLADRLMELQLDPLAARVLERRIRGLGIKVRCEQRTEAITDAGVALQDGTVIAADLVVFATGIRPEVALARDAGLEVGRGVLVDDNLRASEPGVWAVGECAEHRGVTVGLVAPALQMARAAGADIAGKPASYVPGPVSTKLKVAGIDLFCAGELEADDEVVALDTRAGYYRREVYRGEQRVGQIVLGDPPALDGEVVDPVVCACLNVTKSEIQAGRAGKAGTGCGSCAAMVASIQAEAAEVGFQAVQTEVAEAIEVVVRRPVEVR